VSPSLDERVAIFSLSGAEQIRKFGNAGRDLSRLILRHEVRRSASPRFVFEIDVSDREVIGVADDVRDAAIFFDCPRRMVGHCCIVGSSIRIIAWVALAASL